MKKFLSLFCSMLFAIALLVGCAEDPTMNASSEEKYKASIEVMAKGMSDTQKQQFEEACEKVRKHHTDKLMKSMSNKEEAQALGLAALNDKTADEIIKEANSL